MRHVSPLGGVRPVCRIVYLLNRLGKVFGSAQGYGLEFGFSQLLMMALLVIYVLQSCCCPRDSRAPLAVPAARMPQLMVLVKSTEPARTQVPKPTRPSQMCPARQWIPWPPKATL